MIIAILWLVLLPNCIPYFKVAWRWTANANLLFKFRVITDILEFNDHPVFN
jgi:hypothetical protein